MSKRLQNILVCSLPALLRTVMPKVLPTLLLTVSLACLSACSMEPWVKPYERSNLADPIMKFSRAPASDAYIKHVYEAREAIRGAEGGGGGGCGCN